MADAMTRRDFLRATGVNAGVAGLALTGVNNARGGATGGVNCILLFLVGGPSQLDTWDLKPNAPSWVRGPFRPIRTNVPGIEICEHFPRMARMADRFAIVRSVHHHEPLIHEAGQQLMQTGRIFERGVEYPHVGAVLSCLCGPPASGLPSFVVLPGPMGFTGAAVSHGQGAGMLGRRHEPYSPGRNLVHPAFDVSSERDRVRQRYGNHDFGRSCLRARRLVERGVRCATVNMTNTIFRTASWDCHADGSTLDSSLDDYRDTLCPVFDQAYSALLEDLHLRGLLASTLVVALGEFGRTPRLNPRGGRDHWPGVWSVLFAGGGIRGGQVVGASDSLGAEPRDRPVRAADVAATVYRALGIDPATRLGDSGGQSMPLADGNGIDELLNN